MRWISLFLASLALLFSLVPLAQNLAIARDAVYALSMWTEKPNGPVTLLYLGVLPVASCYVSGLDPERTKEICVGRRYYRPHQSLVKTGD